MMSIETKLIEWLSSRLAVPVSADVPEVRPPSFVTVERTGGDTVRAYGGALVQDNPEMAIQCWAHTRAEAESLACAVDDLLPTFAYEPHIGRVARNSLYNFPDETGHVGRYQLVVDITTN
ncbi:MAG: hypothetical protein LBQ21_07460 [Clostridiales Family XIII bacterium]|jgi:hypothetical protein|nr:hypothetical protein [Clostridiales Family XIII bacterium]